ncbi:MAG: hypothetical protein AB7E95_08505, partial [Kiritimatiellales bacterium]
NRAQYHKNDGTKIPGLPAKEFFHFTRMAYCSFREWNPTRQRTSPWTRVQALPAFQTIINNSL